MEEWNFKVKATVQEIIHKLDTKLGSVNGLMFEMNLDNKDFVTFKLRKRILYAWYLIFLNSIVVHGKILKIDTENETEVEITFKQHFLWKLVVFTHLLLGLGILFAIKSGENSTIYMYLFSAITILIGVLLWFRLRRKYKRNIREYKALISEVLEFKKNRYSSLKIK